MIRPPSDTPSRRGQISQGTPDLTHADCLEGQEGRLCRFSVAIGAAISIASPDPIASVVSAPHAGDEDWQKDQNVHGSN
jgi:hypothetical protein